MLICPQGLIRRRISARSALIRLISARSALIVGVP